MRAIRTFRRKCDICRETKDCFCADFTEIPQQNKTVMNGVLDDRRLKRLERYGKLDLNGGTVLAVCEDCAETKGSIPKKLWITWGVSWVLIAAGAALGFAAPSMNAVSMVLAGIGWWVMLFAALFLTAKAGLGFGMTLLLGLLSITPLGLIILPLLRGDINRNCRILSALLPVAEERVRGMNAAVPGTVARGSGSIPEQYRAGLQYLDSCGALDADKLRRFNEITGNRLTGEDIARYAQAAAVSPGGWDMVRDELRNVTAEAAAAFEKLQGQGIDLSMPGR